ncbi:hypothetical protein GIW81_07305 [Hyphomicrobium sp. xq]|uniref:Uncharacterized protein n=1 Tax=Hyphomicrobium album TaxID=2665159 RepID=A0A6I3KIH9_9HYPH|nr:hypothetical protein [Hyphomicrobium album]MTD94143.1 hypothetical protein [Hyphomicrobium album]
MRFLAVILLVASASAALAQQTTRIETRPYYGAVVTIEHGVRVYRPVPPTTHLIVNPDGATPLEINAGAGTSVRRSSTTTNTDR